MPFDGLRAGCEPLSLAGTAVLGSYSRKRSAARTRGDQRVIPSTSVRRDLRSGLSHRHGSHHRDRRDENLGPQLARSCPAALYGSLPALSPSKGRRVRSRQPTRLASKRSASAQIESGAGGRERGAPPGAEASAVTRAFRRAPGGAVRGQDPDTIACFRFGGSERNSVTLMAVSRRRLHIVLDGGLR